MTAQFVDRSVAHVTLRWGFNAREGAVAGIVSPPAYLFATTQGNALQLHVTGTGTLDFEVSYWEEE